MCLLIEKRVELSLKYVYNLIYSLSKNGFIDQVIYLIDKYEVIYSTIGIVQLIENLIRSDSIDINKIITHNICQQITGIFLEMLISSALSCDKIGIAQLVLMRLVLIKLICF